MSGGVFLHSDSTFSSGTTNSCVSHGQASTKLPKSLGSYWQGLCLRQLLAHTLTFLTILNSLSLGECRCEEERTYLAEVSSFSWDQCCTNQCHFKDPVGILRLSVTQLCPWFWTLLAQKARVLLLSALSHASDSVAGHTHLPSSPPHLGDSLGCLDRLCCSLKAEGCKRGLTKSGQSWLSQEEAERRLHLNKMHLLEYCTGSLCMLADSGGQSVVC